MTRLTPTAQHTLLAATREALAVCVVRLGLVADPETGELPLQEPETLEDKRK